MKKILLVLMLSIASIANTLNIGDSLPTITLEDQFEKTHTISKTLMSHQDFFGEQENLLQLLLMTIMLLVMEFPTQLFTTIQTENDCQTTIELIFHQPINLK